MRIHSGGLMNMVTGGAYDQYKKQKWTPRFQLRPSFWEWTMSWPRWYWPDTSWKIRDTVTMKMLSIKITRASSNCKRMVYYHLASGQETSMTNIISSLIVSRSTRHLLNSVPLWICSRIVSQMHCRDLNFVGFVILFLVSMQTTLTPIIRLEVHFLNR